jgi:Lrp/AsnC family transcriptional regulator
VDSARNPPIPDLDSTDVRILQCLQDDASQSLAQIAECVHLSPNACWHRIKRMEEGGTILRRVAILDPAKVGAGLTIFVMVRAAEHSEAWFEKFASAVRDIPAVTEFHRTSGEIDYVLKLQVRDVASYDEVYKKLIATHCADVSAVFSMEEIKYTTAVPLPTAAPR